MPMSTALSGIGKKKGGREGLCSGGFARFSLSFFQEERVHVLTLSNTFNSVKVYESNFLNKETDSRGVHLLIQILLDGNHEMIGGLPVIVPRYTVHERGAVVFQANLFSLPASADER